MVVSLVPPPRFVRAAHVRSSTPGKAPDPEFAYALANVDASAYESRVTIVLPPHRPVEACDGPALEGLQIWASVTVDHGVGLAAERDEGVEAVEDLVPSFVLAVADEHVDAQMGGRNASRI